VPPLGAELVQKHDQEIEEEAARVGVDPDLLRAIMYVEVSQGYYGYPFEKRDWVDAHWPMATSFKPVLDLMLPQADSILPMNVKRSLWGGLLNDGQNYSRRYIEAGRNKGVVIDQTRDVLDNPRLNIRAGAILLKRIQDRLADPSIRNVATLYNGLAQPAVTNYGAQVEQAYRNREWEQTGPEPWNTSIGRGPRPR
jgi:soluble lytic murein transglycosylase-like protein